MIYASDTVNTVEDDVTCVTGECYSPCGEISMPPGFDKYREDVVIRRFHIRITEIADLIGIKPKFISLGVFLYYSHNVHHMSNVSRKKLGIRPSRAMGHNFPLE